MTRLDRIGCNVWKCKDNLHVVQEYQDPPSTQDFAASLFKPYVYVISHSPSQLILHHSMATSSLSMIRVPMCPLDIPIYPKPWSQSSAPAAVLEEVAATWRSHDLSFTFGKGNANFVEIQDLTSFRHSSLGPVSCLLVEEFCPFLKALGWDWSCCKQEHEVWFHKEVASHKVSILRNRRLAAIIITRDSRRWASPT